MSTPCCGCHVVSDYGTSTVQGSGEPDDPFSVTQIDPEFNKPVVKVSRTVAQSIPNNSETPITFNSMSFDTHGMFDVGDPTRLTVQIAGLYTIGFNFNWAAGNGVVREVYFRKNGTEELDRQSQISNNATPINHYFDMTYQWFFQPGEYIEAVVFQLSGGNLAFSNFESFLWMMYLGRKV